MKTNKNILKSLSLLVAFLFLYSLSTFSLQAGNDDEPEPDPIHQEDDEDAGDDVLPCGVMPSDSTSYGFPFMIILRDGTIITE